MSHFGKGEKHITSDFPFILTYDCLLMKVINSQYIMYVVVLVGMLEI